MFHEFQQCIADETEKSYGISQLPSFLYVLGEYTRSEIVRGNVISKSLIDHCYTNVSEKVRDLKVLPIGTSDHMAVYLTKHCNSFDSRPKFLKKRSYKNFNIEHFLTDINNSAINSRVTCLNDLDQAAEEFQNMFLEILDSHAPIKTYQMRKNYLLILPKKLRT